MLTIADSDRSRCTTKHKYTSTHTMGTSAESRLQSLLSQYLCWQLGLNTRSVFISTVFLVSLFHWHAFSLSFIRFLQFHTFFYTVINVAAYSCNVLPDKLLKSVSLIYIITIKKQAITPLIQVILVGTNVCIQVYPKENSPVWLGDHKTIL